MLFVSPEETVPRLPVREGQVVADFGCGTGLWSLQLAHRVGERGHVYAFEIQKNLLDALDKEIREKGLTQIEPVLADLDELEGSRLERESVDGVLIANSLFQFEKKEIALREAYRVIRPGGWCAVVDWSDSFGGLGPHPDQVVPKDAAIHMSAKAGFVFDGEFQTGGHHYGILFKK